MKENDGGSPIIEQTNAYILAPPPFPQQRTSVDSYNCPLVFKFLMARSYYKHRVKSSHTSLVIIEELFATRRLFLSYRTTWASPYSLEIVAKISDNSPGNISTMISAKEV